MNRANPFPTALKWPWLIYIILNWLWFAYAVIEVVSCSALNPISLLLLVFLLVPALMGNALWKWQRKYSARSEQNEEVLDGEELEAVVEPRQDLIQRRRIVRTYAVFLGIHLAYFALLLYNYFVIVITSAHRDFAPQEFQLNFAEYFRPWMLIQAAVVVSATLAFVHVVRVGRYLSGQINTTVL